MTPFAQPGGQPGGKNETERENAKEHLKKTIHGRLNLLATMSLLWSNQITSQYSGINNAETISLLTGESAVPLDSFFTLINVALDKLESGDMSYEEFIGEEIVRQFLMLDLETLTNTRIILPTTKKIAMQMLNQAAISSLGDSKKDQKETEIREMIEELIKKSVITEETISECGTLELQEIYSDQGTQDQIESTHQKAIKAGATESNDPEVDKSEPDQEWVDVPVDDMEDSGATSSSKPGQKAGETMPSPPNYTQPLALPGTQPLAIPLTVAIEGGPPSAILGDRPKSHAPEAFHPTQLGMSAIPSSSFYYPFGSKPKVASFPLPAALPRGVDNPVQALPVVGEDGQPLGRRIPVHQSLPPSPRPSIPPLGCSKGVDAANEYAIQQVDYERIPSFIIKMPNMHDAYSVPTISFIDSHGKVSNFTPLLSGIKTDEGIIYSMTAGAVSDCTFDSDVYRSVSDTIIELEIVKGEARIRALHGQLYAGESEDPIGDTWTKVDEETEYQVVFAKAGKQWRKNPEMRFRVNPSETTAGKDLRSFATEQITQLVELREARFREHGYNDQLALQIGNVLSSLAKTEAKYKIGLMSPQTAEVVSRTSEEIRSKIEGALMALEIDTDALESYIAAFKKRTEVRQQKDKIRAGQIEERKTADAEKGQPFDVLHIEADEDPETSEVAYRGPVFSIVDLGAPNSKKAIYPLILDENSFGSNQINTQELPVREGSKRKYQTREFMAELLYEKDEEKYYVRCLDGYISMAKGCDRPPPRETFEVTPGQEIVIGRFVLKVEGEIHAYSHQAIWSEVERQVLIEMEERIRNQELTTTKQDEKAHQANLDIINGNLAGSRTAEMVEDIKQAYGMIFLDLWQEVNSWYAHNPTADSGRFQTLEMLSRICSQDDIFKQDLHASRFELMEAAKERAQEYINAANRIKRGRVAMKLNKIFAGWGHSSSKDLLSGEDTDRRVSRMGVVEIARLIEMKLIDLSFIDSLYTPKEYRQQIGIILSAREGFARLENEEKGDISALMNLNEQFSELTMEEVMAPEEIRTINHHIEVNLEPTDKVERYIRKLAIFEARKAFYRLMGEVKGNRKPEDTDSDLKMINGLREAGLVKTTDLVADIEHLMQEAEIDKVIKERSDEVDSDKTRQEAIEEVANDAAEAIQRQLVQVASVYRSMQGDAGIDKLINMMKVAHIANSEDVAKALEGEKMHVRGVEIKLATEGSAIGTESKKITWDQITGKWKTEYLSMAKMLATHAAEGNSTRFYLDTVLGELIDGGAFTHEQLGVTDEDLQEGLRLEQEKNAEERKKNIEQEKVEFCNKSMAQACDDFSFMDEHTGEVEQDRKTAFNDAKKDIARAKFTHIAQQVQDDKRDGFRSKFLVNGIIITYPELETVLDSLPDEQRDLLKIA